MVNVMLRFSFPDKIQQMELYLQFPSCTQWNLMEIIVDFMYRIEQILLEPKKKSYVEV